MTGISTMADSRSPIRAGFSGSRRDIFLLAMMVSTLAASSCRTTGNDSQTNCRNLAHHAFDGLVIKTTEVVTQRNDLPPFCAILGTIDPEIGFEARLPLSGWNGKFYQSGCGGYCGQVLPDKKGYSNTINPALASGFATITTDSGHSGSLGDASWAKDHPVAVEMYAHKSIPLTYSAGNSLVEAYYGKAADRALFGGCSNGGRMAAMAAQRYPSLFDGILGGGAVLNLSQNGGLHGSWVVQTNTGPDGERILNDENFTHKLPALHEAIIEQCDATDGQIDGVISLPRNCRVDVSVLPQCSDSGPDPCFTASELGVLEKWYQGPVNSAGQSLYPGMPAGSEPYWRIWFLDRGGETAPGNALGGDYTRYLGFENGAPDDYTALDFEFDSDPARLAARGELFDAMDTNLSAFHDAGGKFLMWHGWQDPLVLPDQSVAYYEGVAEDLGGPEKTGEFFRLFMVPGQGHCWEIPSEAPDRFDPITALDRWVETGVAPTELTATALKPGSSPIDTTVICPWPGAPHYFDGNEEPPANLCTNPASSLVGEGQ